MSARKAHRDPIRIEQYRREAIGDSLSHRATRLLCAYPQTAKYSGKGDTNDANNFVCRSAGNAPVASIISQPGPSASSCGRGGSLRGFATSSGTPWQLLHMMAAARRNRSLKCSAAGINGNRRPTHDTNSGRRQIFIDDDVLHQLGRRNKLQPLLRQHLARRSESGGDDDHAERVSVRTAMVGSGSPRRSNNGLRSASPTRVTEVVTQRALVSSDSDWPNPADGLCAPRRYADCQTASPPQLGRLKFSVSRPT